MPTFNYRIIRRFEVSNEIEIKAVDEDEAENKIAAMLKGDDKKLAMNSVVLTTEEPWTIDNDETDYEPM